MYSINILIGFYNVYLISLCFYNSKPAPLFQPTESTKVKHEISFSLTLILFLKIATNLMLFWPRIFITEATMLELIITALFTRIYHCFFNLLEKLTDAKKEEFNQKTYKCLIFILCICLFQIFNFFFHTNSVDFNLYLVLFLFQMFVVYQLSKVHFIFLNFGKSFEHPFDLGTENHSLIKNVGLIVANYGFY